MKIARITKALLVLGLAPGGFSGARVEWRGAMFHVSGVTRWVKQSFFYQELQYRRVGSIDASGGNILFDLRCLEAT